ncbi:MAG: VOC family protein, partial [Pseudomonadota bacterium]
MRTLMHQRQISQLVVIAFCLIVSNALAHDVTDFSFPTTEFGVKDVNASVDYYVNVLGFSKAFDFPEGEVHKTFASVTRGETTLFLSENEEDAGHGNIHISVPDV